MNDVNKTMYIPLYGKSYVSRKGIILGDKKAEEIWDAQRFELKGKSKSKWLAYYMGMRSAVFDNWLKAQMKKNQDAIIIHIGCGMDSRVERVGTMGHLWYDVDFSEVIRERKKYYHETETYHMVEADVRDEQWLRLLPKDKPAIVVMEGVSMYFTQNELKCSLEKLCNYFGQLNILMDCYTALAAKISKYKNPINDVGVTTVYGIDTPESLENSLLSFVKEHEMTPNNLINELNVMEKLIFKKVFAGAFSKRMYRLYEYAGSSWDMSNL